MEKFLVTEETPDSFVLVIPKSWRKFYTRGVDTLCGVDLINVREKLTGLFIEAVRKRCSKLDTWLLEKNNKYKLLRIRYHRLHFVKLQEE